MNRSLSSAFAVVFLAVFAAEARASFLYLLPDPTATGTFSLIFQSAPLTASAESAEKLGVQTISTVGDDGKRTQVPVQKEDKRTVAKGTGGAAVATVDFGVSNRGEGQLVLLRFHAKTQQVGGKELGLPLEVTPKAVSGGVQFLVTSGGKPFAATVTVFEPGATDPRTVTTDADGRTPTYSTVGRYAVKVGRFEKQKGEHEGRAFTGVWEYSTLVTDVK